MNGLNGILQYQLCNGSWMDCNNPEYGGDRTKSFLDRCEKHNKHNGVIGLDQVIEALNSGKELRNSPEDWYSNCRLKPVEIIIDEPRIPKKRGQLWQQCQCGNEPVYMPLELCSKCWPK